jgi:hypothetical protein
VSHKNKHAIAVLSRPDHPDIKLLIDDQTITIKPKDAILRLERNDYVMCWNSKRVRWIRGITSKSGHKICWRTTKAVVLEPGLEWGR